MNVTVINETGVDAAVETNERTGADGNKELIITLSRETARRDIQTRGPLAKSLEVAYRLTRRWRPR